jgi:uncharacterized protein (DUF305 family)
MKKPNYPKPAAAAVAIAGLVAEAVLGGCRSDAGKSQDASSDTDHAAIGHGGSGGHAMGTSGIEALKVLRVMEFDIALLSQMIAHHQGAIDMSELVPDRSERAEVKQ